MVLSFSKPVAPITSQQLRDRITALQEELSGYEQSAARAAVDFAQEPDNAALAKIAEEAMAAVTSRRSHIAILTDQIPTAVQREHEEEAKRLVAEEGAKRRARQNLLSNGGSRLLDFARDYDRAVERVAKARNALADQAQLLGLRFELPEPAKPIMATAEGKLARAKEEFAALSEYGLKQAIEDLDWEMRQRSKTPEEHRRHEVETTYNAKGEPVEFLTPYPEQRPLRPGEVRRSFMDPGSPIPPPVDTNPHPTPQEPTHYPPTDDVSPLRALRPEEMGRYDGVPPMVAP